MSAPAPAALTSPAPEVSPAPAADRPRRVLHSLRRSTPGGSTYADLVEAAPPPGWEQDFFTWGRALLGRYDVFHVHWPEQLVRDSRRPWLRWVRRRMLDLLLLRLRLRGVPVVWTAHNPAPHEQGTAAERRSLLRFSRRVATTVHLTAAGRGAGESHVEVPHSHYREHFARVTTPAARATEQVPGRVLYFGIIRPYKGVEALLQAFSDLDDPGAGLRVVGHPHPGQAEVVHAACDRDDRVSAVLRYVDDEELVREVRAAQLVVLPYRGQMHNSGTLLAALSLDRPVLVPRSATNTTLSERVGPGWVLEYDGDIDPQTLADALERTTVPAASAPLLAAHSPRRVAAQHRDAYERAVRAARRTTA